MVDKMGRPRRSARVGYRVKLVGKPVKKASLCKEGELLVFESKFSIIDASELTHNGVETLSGLVKESIDFYFKEDLAELLADKDEYELVFNTAVIKSTATTKVTRKYKKALD